MKKSSVKWIDCANVKLLQVANFSVSFNTQNGIFRAVKAISFEVKKGEIFAIIGESGSGKSVLCQSLTRLMNKAQIEGNAHFYTAEDTIVNLTTCDEVQLRKIRKNHVSYIFQEPMTALNPLMTCGAQILENAKENSTEYLKRILQKVELLDAGRIAKSYPHQLSGGQRQRVMIAMALASQPDLIIADEPTTALDSRTQQEIQKLLKKLTREEGVSVLFITHDLKSLDGFADQIGVLYQGTLIEKGDANSVLQQPKESYTQALIKSRPSYRSKGYTLPEVQDFLNTSNVFKPEKIIDWHSEKQIISIENIEFGHFQKNGLRKQYLKILENINFSIQEGDILGIIGESGSGKSTLANLLLSIWKPIRGHISFNDDDKKHRSDFIQLVFQDPYASLNPKHQIGEAMMEAARATKNISRMEAKAQCLELLTEVGLLASDFNKYPSEFSGGQRQRICIAKALIKKPNVLVLDEAVAALDVSIQAKILNLLHHLKVKYQLTYVLISHDMNVVAYFCNKLMVLQEGQIVEMGETSELVNFPNHPLTEKLLKHCI